MLTIIRTNSNDQDFINLVKQLDAYLAVKDGRDHAFYDQYNKLDKIKHVVVAYDNNQPVGCGAIKEYDSNTMEVKRMFTLPECRGKGIAEHQQRSDAPATVLAINAARKFKMTCAERDVDLQSQLDCWPEVSRQTGSDE